MALVARLLNGLIRRSNIPLNCCRLRVIRTRALLIALNGKSRSLPSPGAACKGVGSGNSFFVQFECQTGTRVFGRSGTVCDDLLPYGKHRQFVVGRQRDA